MIKWPLDTYFAKINGKHPEVQIYSDRISIHNNKQCCLHFKFRLQIMSRWLVMFLHCVMAMLAQLDLHGVAQPQSQLEYLEPLEKWRRWNNCYKLSRTAHGQKWRTITTPRAMRQREHNCPSEWVQEFSTPDLQQNTAATISIEKLNVLWARAFALLQG